MCASLQLVPSYASAIVMLLATLCACTEATVVRKLEPKICSPYVPAPPKRIEDVLDGASTIVLARVHGYDANHRKVWIGENVVYRLGVAEVFKGDKSVRADGLSFLKIEGVKPRYGFLFDPYLFVVMNQHREFLQSAETEADANIVRDRFYLQFNTRYCEYAPYFDVGINYLVVITEPYSVVSFEPILSADDPWYQRVAEKFRGQQ
jgi:hypothetical protein